MWHRRRVFEYEGMIAETVGITGHDGKPIRARNKTQQDLVSAYFENDLIFAVGPAGTGKTYMAIALAVRALKNREIKRIILSLQKHDTDNVSTPADWNPGDAVVMGAPLTLDAAKNRMENADDTMIPYSWYLTMKKQ